ncbi:Aminopeptidase 2 [Fusarium agapanthi]|uniref:Aminopeptidase 2 n=1 Tax=Fusarium agapanthi TaxID=1803897 RepID=A0A9P5E5H4_9HYPO|nr:Aminopeptidase 2 [Fusarium agapanthi]
MGYWDGLWLKEGFVTLMSWYAADKMFQSWHFWDSYAANTVQKALNLDSLTSSHPVELFISDPTDAKQIYDEISYQKGSCILRMVLNSLGDTKFFDGFKLYLRRYQFQYTESDDLWTAWEEVTGESVAVSMRLWTKQPGFPVLQVSESRDESGKVTGIRLFQQRFLTSGVANEEDAASDIMYPLRFTLRRRHDVVTIDMNKRELVLPPSDGLFKVNADHGSFFRTSYSHELLTRLLDEASKGNLSLRDCIGLSYDLKALVAAGVNKTSELLDLNIKFAELDSFYFEEPELNKAIRKLARDVTGPKAEELGWTISKDDDENLITFKTSLFSGTGLAGYPSVVSAAKEIFAKRMAGDKNTIPGSLRWEVFGIVAAHGGLEELEHLVDLWKTSSNEDEHPMQSS